MYPNQKFVVVLASILLTYVMSLMTYKYVETVFNSRSIVSQKIWILALTLGQVISISLFCVMFAGVSKGWNQDWALNSHAVMNRGCDSGDIDKENCHWNVDNSTGSVYLAGDSMSWAIADSFIDISNRKGLNLRTFTRNACSVTKVEHFASDSCSVWRRTVIQKIVIDKPNVVIIANSSGYIQPELLGVGLLIKELNAKGIKVLFILPPPGGDDYSGRRALAFRPGGDNRFKDLVPKFDFAEVGLSDYVSPTNFLVYDPSEFLCKQSCIITREGHDFYTYGGHLSVFGEKFLQPSLNRALTKLLES
jgi:hypothetical protein